MKKIHLIEISIALALVLSVIFSIVGFGFQCADIRKDVVRLHILANSDSENDQAVKLLVRDAVLNCGEEIFSGTVNAQNAELIINEEKDQIVAIVNRILEENGFDYKSQISVTEEYFSTRSYENFTLPAGNYKAVKIVLGKGEGHNWWCVMFPPLCLPAASKNTELDVVFGETGAKIVSDSSKYEIKFKIIEILEKIKVIINTEKQC